jgi:photosystem II stability/assembly factor-like uncharacterized protein
MRYPLSIAVLATAAALSLAPAAPVQAQRSAGVPIVLDSAVLAGFSWRNIGPDRGGRSIAVAGVKGRPGEAYFGAVGGGLWKTTDGGESWAPVTDHQITSASVGAVAVSESDPDLVFIGTGESCIRGNIMPGDGIYRSRDGGSTWQHVGFRNVDAISRIGIHPTNPDIVFAAVFGKYSAPSEERGVYMSRDGGATWRRVLFRNDSTAAVDISIDRNNPDVVYAALWQAYRTEYTMSSGGAGSGLYRSADGGETWTELTRAAGLPQEGVVGRIGVAVSGANSDRVYALIEHENGGLFASDDAGASWSLVNDDRSIRQRAFYYTHVFADPADKDVVYLENTSLFRSTDGGKTLKNVSNGTHGDFHDLWIDPDDAGHLVVGNDGGGAVSVDTAQSWTAEDFPTAQFYHVITTGHIPFHVCGSQQDNSTMCTPSAWNAGVSGYGTGGRGGARRDTARDITAGSTRLSYVAGGGEPGYIAPDPLDPDIFYSGTNNGSYVDRYNRRLGTSREVNPYPWFYSGEPAIDIRERWQWTFPILFSQADPRTLYVSSQRLWKTSDGGSNWNALSGDLTRADPATLGPSGGPITGDMNGPEVYATIFSVGPGKRNVDVIWTGSDDGLVHVTRDGGATWTNVTPPDMPEFGRVSQIDASSFGDGTAYVSVRRPLLDDHAPYIFRTSDYGRTWKRIVDGVRQDAYVHAVREDPTRPGLLYAATQHGVYVSFDDGDHWQNLSLNLPDVPVADLIVERNELVIATHGRSFWILDNIAPLRQMTTDLARTRIELFTPPVGYRSGGALPLTWWLRDQPRSARLDILDASGNVLRTFEPDTTRSDSARSDLARSDTARSDSARSDSVRSDSARSDSARSDTAAAPDPADRYRNRPPLPLEAGIQHVSWDLRTNNFVVFPGMILWGVRSPAPALPPGAYTARLIADDDTATAPITIARNPRIMDVSAADLRAQYEFSRAVWEKVNEANGAVIAIRSVRAQLQERTEAANDARLRAAAATLEENASAIEASIYQVKNRSGQDPLNFPIRVNNRLANLLSMSERGDGTPGSNMPEIFSILSSELKGYTDRLADVWAADLAAVNRELERLGLSPIDIGRKGLATDDGNQVR